MLNKVSGVYPTSMTARDDDAWHSQTRSLGQPAITSNRLRALWWEPGVRVGGEPPKALEPKRKRRKTHGEIPLWSWLATGAVLGVLGLMAYCIVRRGKDDGGDDGDDGNTRGGSSGGKQLEARPARANGGDEPEPPMAALGRIDAAHLYGYRAPSCGAFSACALAGAQMQFVGFMTQALSRAS